MDVFRKTVRCLKCFNWLPASPSSKASHITAENDLFHNFHSCPKVDIRPTIELFGIGYSWGGFESLILFQNLRTNTKYTQTRQYLRFAKDEYIVRLHIGLEEPKDLIEDLKRSLKYIK